VLGFAALSIGGCAAFFSVYGIGQLFKGAMVAVIIMASALELGKLVAASFLQRYWKTANKLIRFYLIIGVVLLMLITSCGIYGFLSSAYQETFQKMAVNDNQIMFLDTKKQFYADDVARFDRELENISENISTLSNAKATSIQVRDKNTETGYRNTISTAELRVSQKRIDIEEQNKTATMEKRSIAADSLQKYQLGILEKKNDTEISGELGPLTYVSNLTGMPMAEVVNWFILLFIFVFDPLAITLVVATNWVFEKEALKRRENDEGNIEITNDAVNDAVTETVNDAVTETVNDAVTETVNTTNNTVSEVVNITNDAVSETVDEVIDTVDDIAKENVDILPVGMVQVKVTPTHNSRIKPEDVAQVRNNAKNVIRKIPADRGY
jgi:hypothetical protein